MARDRATSMEVSCWVATDTGRVRQANEDSYLVDPKLGLYIVCDGMGGHAAGEVASAAAAQIVADVLGRNEPALVRCRKRPSPEHRKHLLSLLGYAVREACARIYRMAQEDPSRRGMGTTLSMLLLCGRTGFVAHVGDSRIYLLRQGQLHLMTEDHSLVNELLRRGRLTPEEISELPIKNAVTRAVGVHETVAVDTHEFDLLPEDRFLLCSDGLHNYLDLPGTQRYLLRSDPTRIAQECVDFANASGGKDNITVLVLSIGQTADDDHTKRFQRGMGALGQLEVFHSLSYTELTLLMNVAQQRTVEAGERINAPGDEPAFYVVLDGKVLVRHGQRVLGRVSAGGSLGLVSIARGAEPDVFYFAEQTTSLLLLARQALYELFRVEHALAAKALWNVAQILGRHVPTGAVEVNRPKASPLTTIWQPPMSVAARPPHDPPAEAQRAAIHHVAPPAKPSDNIEDLTSDALLIDGVHDTSNHSAAVHQVDDVPQDSDEPTTPISGASKAVRAAAQALDALERAEPTPPSRKPTQPELTTVSSVFAQTNRFRPASRARKTLVETPPPPVQPAASPPQAKPAAGSALPEPVPAVERDPRFARLRSMLEEEKIDSEQDVAAVLTDPVLESDAADLGDLSKTLVEGLRAIERPRSGKPATPVADEASVDTQTSTYQTIAPSSPKGMPHRTVAGKVPRKPPHER